MKVLHDDQIHTVFNFANKSLLNEKIVSMYETRNINIFLVSTTHMKCIGLKTCIDLQTFLS